MYHYHCQHQHPYLHHHLLYQSKPSPLSWFSSWRNNSSHIFVDYLLLILTVWQVKQLCTFAMRAQVRPIQARRNSQPRKSITLGPKITSWLGGMHICTQAAFPHPCLKCGSECMLIHGAMPGWQLWGVNFRLSVVQLWVTAFIDVYPVELCLRHTWQVKHLRDCNALFETP